MPSIDVSFIDEEDPHVNALGVKGIREVAIVGVAAAWRTRSTTRPDGVSAISPDRTDVRATCATMHPYRRTDAQ
ncbi:MAG: hypothetical protein ACR2JO_01305 [Mycobacteriales bacterium]